MTSRFDSLRLLASLPSVRKTITASVAVAALGQAAAQTCNANIPLTRPNDRYEAVAGATPAGSEVKDKVTGLIWKRCLEGMSWSGTACTGSPSSFTWVNALERARVATATSASPASTWRLPNRSELLSLAETACFSPAINTTWFPNQPNGSVLSASPHAGNADLARVVVFADGSVNTIVSKGMGISVRLVRSGQ